MTVYERVAQKAPPLRALRRRALAQCLARIRFEQQASNFQALSPVNGILNTIALFAHDPHDPMIEPRSNDGADPEAVWIGGAGSAAAVDMLVRP